MNAGTLIRKNPRSKAISRMVARKIYGGDRLEGLPLLELQAADVVRVEPLTEIPFKVDVPSFGPKY